MGDYYEDPLSWEWSGYPLEKEERGGYNPFTRTVHLRLTESIDFEPERIEEKGVVGRISEIGDIDRYVLEHELYHALSEDADLMKMVFVTNTLSSLMLEVYCSGFSGEEDPELVEERLIETLTMSKLAEIFSRDVGALLEVYALLLSGDLERRVRKLQDEEDLEPREEIELGIEENVLSIREELDSEEVAQRLVVTLILHSLNPPVSYLGTPRQRYEKGKEMGQEGKLLPDKRLLESVIFARGNLGAVDLSLERGKEPEEIGTLIFELLGLPMEPEVSFQSRLEESLEKLSGRNSVVSWMGDSLEGALDIYESDGTDPRPPMLVFYTKNSEVVTMMDERKVGPEYRSQVQKLYVLHRLKRQIEEVVQGQSSELRCLDNAYVACTDSCEKCPNYPLYKDAEDIVEYLRENENIDRVANEVRGLTKLEDFSFSV